MRRVERMEMQPMKWETVWNRTLCMSSVSSPGSVMNRERRTRGRKRLEERMLTIRRFTRNLK